MKKFWGSAKEIRALPIEQFVAPRYAPWPDRKMPPVAAELCRAVRRGNYGLALYRYQQCPLKAYYRTTPQDEPEWCGFHDPNAVRAKAIKEQEAWEAQHVAWQEQAEVRAQRIRAHADAFALLPALRGVLAAYTTPRPGFSEDAEALTLLDRIDEILAVMPKEEE